MDSTRPRILLSGAFSAADSHILAAAAEAEGMSLCTELGCFRIAGSVLAPDGSLYSSEAPIFAAGDLPGALPLPLPLTAAAAALLARHCAAEMDHHSEVHALAAEVAKYRRQRQQFLRIGTALSMQNSLEDVLDTILHDCRGLCGADAGSVYIREQGEQGRGFADRLRFKVAHNDSVDLGPTTEFTIDMDPGRIAGYVAHTGEPLIISDVYHLPPAVPYGFSADFDQRFGYRTKSMLTVPLTNLDGIVVGVLQLMNKKTDPAHIIRGCEDDARIIDFTWTDREIVESMSSIAAVTIERAILYENIQHIFEGFLSSSAAAIDERDRVTSGHSRRVMEYALAFADAMDAAKGGPFGLVFDHHRRRQFKFAALLHDIGKIGVPEGVLTKNTRISAEALDNIRLRFDILRSNMQNGTSGVGAWFGSDQVLPLCDELIRINRAAGLSPDDVALLCRLRELTWFDSSGVARPLITPEEFSFLSVARGNLSDHERDLINSHAAATARILSEIPWTEELAGIPDIAAHHHERMDGSGYPDGLFADAICLESRILSVVDIFDALVAQDRPYKPPMPPEKALSILHEEAARGHLDAAVVAFFDEQGIWRHTGSPGVLAA